ncbi:hypothetical protein [Corynebacterium sp. HMSC076D02]|uniref:hypothetical protein n=1 Tax=Corynebacterium sp. HMSC076D02 TaxID=1739439 RepID=UPI001FED8B24|nr:hypothetical protein [Corynebacterium sp. HMSC076D02]
MDGVVVCFRKGRLVRHQSVDGDEADEEDDKRSDKAQDSGDFIDVEKPRDEHQHQHDQGAHPRWEGRELLGEVGAAAGEHDKAHRKKRDNGGPVKDFRGDRRGDLGVNGGMLRSLEIGTKL